MLDAAGVAFADLRACETDLQAAEQSFVQGSQMWSNKKYGDAVSNFASGLNTIAKSVSDCGVAQELAFLQQEANVLGFANVTIIGEISSIVVHGADFYEALYNSVGDLERYDWRAAGQDLGNVLNQLAEWTKGHACTSPVCYVVVGVLQFLGDIEGSIKACESDFRLRGTTQNLRTATFQTLTTLSFTGIIMPMLSKPASRPSATV